MQIEDLSCEEAEWICCCADEIYVVINERGRNADEIFAFARITDKAGNTAYIERSENKEPMKTVFDAIWRW